MANLYKTGFGKAEPAKPTPKYPLEASKVFTFLRKQSMKNEHKEYLLKIWENEICELYETTGEITLTPVNVNI